MYLCGVCGSCSKPGESRKTHLIEREVPGPHGPRREIAREVPLCSECAFKLARGLTLDQLCREVRAMRIALGKLTPEPPPVTQNAPVAGGKSILRRQ